MKIRLFIILVLGTVLQVVGAKVTPLTRILLDGYDEAASRGDEPSPYRPLLLQLDDPSTATQLADSGVIIYNHRNDIYLTSVPRDQLSFVLGLDGVINAASTGDISSCMDIAMPWANVDRVMTGAGALPAGFDGTGVVVGFSDIGFDARHIAFRGAIARIYDYDTEHGVTKSAETPDEVSQWVTDDPENFHATHVGNIIAGRYLGNEYHGVAPGAEIVATTSRLHDVGILAGVEQIIRYAKSQSKPAVINLSLANFIGPHDGSDLMGRYLSYCSEDAVICISAGNSGGINGYASRDLSKGIGEVLTIGHRSPGSVDVKGILDMWSETDQPFEYCIGAYDCELKTPVYASRWIGADEDMVTIDAETDEGFSRYFTGKVIGASETSSLNSRFNATVYFDVSTTTMTADGKRSKYFGYVAVRRVGGSDHGPRVHFFADSSDLSLYHWENNIDIYGSDASINNMCCADGVIAVGMVNSRSTAPSLDETPFEWKFQAGTINHNSSYNVVEGIPSLPHISAPGSYVISALSSEYYTRNPDTRASAVSYVAGEPYYWFPAQGTSMSSPFAAGVIATWLQADVTLTVHDVIDIAQSTAITGYADIDDPRWGAGCIDAYAGLCKVLSRAGLIDTEMPIKVSVTPDRHIVVTGCDISQVQVYDISGARIDASAALHPGIYVVSVAGCRSVKVAVK